MGQTVEDHYSSDGIVERILAALAVTRSDAPLAAAQFYPFDQFHGRELAATRDHCARLAARHGDQLLDIGSGIGGPARYFATTSGACVTGIDLTPRFVEAAVDLTHLCGLDDRVDFQIADAAQMPFDANRFDAAICFYVGMNLPDKPAVLAQTLRVLKPGGRLIWTEVVLGTGDPTYPLPWAATPQGSHLHGKDALTGLITAAGFTLDSVQDETGAILALAEKMRQSPTPPSPLHLQANAVVLGPDFIERRKNYIRNLAANTIASLCIMAHKPGSA